MPRWTIAVGDSQKGKKCCILRLAFERQAAILTAMSGLTRKGPRFQFSLRALFVLVTVCAVACSWLAVRLLQLERQRQAIAAVEKSGGYVFYDYQISRYVLIDSPDWENPPPGPKWLRDLLGDDFFARVVGASRFVAK